MTRVTTLPARAGAARRGRVGITAGLAPIVAIAAIGCGPTAATSDQGTESVEPALYTVVNVIDGDTLDATDPAGDEVRIRLLGIDTPERGDCGYTEATDRLEELAPPGTSITGTGDDSQAERDAYDRLLLYLELDDGTDIGLQLITDAHAHEYTYDGVPHERAAAYRAAEHDTLTGCQE